MANIDQNVMWNLNRKAGTLANPLDCQGAANVWAGTTGLALNAALYTKAVSLGYTGPRLELQGILNVLAGTTGLAEAGAAAAIP